MSHERVLTGEWKRVFTDPNVQWEEIESTMQVCAVTLQHTATRDNTLQHNTREKIEQTLQVSAVALQHTATHCNTLQHLATHCNTLQLNEKEKIEKLCR